ncbi:MAG: rhodanese-like domain-containing protein [Gammaproteobacteria bacterium]|nr:rhodanese-like domain-containing protein [Gammaproteobacteria bacterium]
MTTVPSIITAEQLVQRLDEAELLIVQVSSAQMYQQAHIPSAVRVTPEELVSGVAPAIGRLPPIERLTALFRRIGLTEEKTVVTYDDEGGGWAGRLAWTLDVIGHRKWCYLDGGLHAWAALNLPLSIEPVEPEPSRIDIVIDATPIAEAEDIIAQLDDEALTIWDCRSFEEFVGQKVQAARGGHIPGAVNLDWLDLMDRSRQLRLVDDLAGVLAARGITPERDVITHCQTHHRSGLTYMAARLLGFQRIRAYHGSWSEWGNREDTPVEV